jgi:Rrf2 family protein
MRVSTKGDYGVRALIELAHHYREGPLQSSEIAARQHIPEPYLDQLLTTLRRAGFIRSVRGPQGGHQLVRDPFELKLSEVIVALEGSLAPIACLEPDSACPKGAACSQREVWDEVMKATMAILEANTIGAMAKREREALAGTRYYI